MVLLYAPPSPTPFPLENRVSELTPPRTKQYALSGLRQRNNQPYGVELALLASLVLAGSSIPRALRTGKPLPVGLSVVAVGGLVRFGMVWQERVR